MRDLILQLSKSSIYSTKPIETAIQEAYSMLEERASRYAANPMISPMIEAMKEDLRQQILDSAEQQRQENGQDGN